ncbi:MAG: nucleotidyl transferase AbiEii/AbiGii toxin family protein [Elusimicrobia bacterium]|nr:nucleotidyl transferase AbiEii/AbiGii toxin family protein [Candidatus Obscuribacterium magneticum]
MKWHKEAVTEGCLRAAGHLRKFIWLKEFYLAGGTALALQYGHRISVDLDFFSETNDLDFSNRQPLIQDLLSAGSQIEEEKDGTVHARLEGAHMSFFRYKYPLLKPLRLWEGIPIAHPLDIGLMKMGAIIGRGSRKDFLDFYVIMKDLGSLPIFFRASKKKFPGVLDFPLQASKALVYFQDADEEPPLRMISPLSWHSVKAFFEKEVRLAHGSISM